MLELERDPVFKMEDIHDLKFDQIRERSMAKVRKFFLFRLLHL